MRPPPDKISGMRGPPDLMKFLFASPRAPSPGSRLLVRVSSFESPRAPPLSVYRGWSAAACGAESLREPWQLAGQIIGEGAVIGAVEFDARAPRSA